MTYKMQTVMRLAEKPLSNSMNKFNNPSTGEKIGRLVGEFSLKKNCRIKILLLLAMIVLPSVVFAQPKILFIGNSFTYGGSDATNKTMKLGGVPALFSLLAQAGGQPKPETEMITTGGQDFRFHNSHAATLTAINEQPWDYVVLQNYSTEPTHLVDGKHSLTNHYIYGTALYQRVMSNNPATHVILYETWSRAAAHPFISGVSGPTNFASTTEFQAELRANYKGVANALNKAYPTNPPVIIAPVGDAWENVGGLRATSDPHYVRLHASDNYHGNDNAYYLAAAVFYATIYHANPHGLSTNALISNLHLNLTVPASLLEDAAWTTVKGSPP
jgi:hypothetical protein